MSPCRPSPIPRPSQAERLYRPRSACTKAISGFPGRSCFICHAPRPPWFAEETSVCGNPMLCVTAVSTLLRPCFFPQNDRDNPPNRTGHNSDDPPNRLPEIRDHHPARYPGKGDQEQRNDGALRGFVVTRQERQASLPRMLWVPKVSDARTDRSPTPTATRAHPPPQ